MILRKIRILFRRKNNLNNKCKELNLVEWMKLIRKKGYKKKTKKYKRKILFKEKE